MEVTLTQTQIKGPQTITTDLTKIKDLGELSSSLQALKPNNSETTQIITYALIATAVVGIFVYHYLKQQEQINQLWFWNIKDYLPDFKGALKGFYEESLKNTVETKTQEFKTLLEKNIAYGQKTQRALVAIALGIFFLLLIAYF